MSKENALQLLRADAAGGGFAKTEGVSRQRFLSAHPFPETSMAISKMERRVFHTLTHGGAIHLERGGDDKVSFRKRFS